MDPLEDFAKASWQPANSSENMLSRSQQLWSFKVDDENLHREDLNATNGEWKFLSGSSG
jgi:hypothetical protein